MRRRSAPPVLRRLLAIAGVLAAAACGDEGTFRPPPADPPRGDSISFRRVGAGGLAIGDAGVAVIRDAESWRTLWRRFSRYAVDSIPAVDFAREMVAAVSLGGMSGCSEAASYAWRVEQGRDSLFVVIAYDGYPRPLSGTTCAMVIAPVDLVVVPRRDGPVVFRGYVAGFRAPPVARWLERPTVAETDTVSEPWRRDQQRVFLARDSATSRAELSRLVDRLDEQGTEELHGALLEHPRVQADLALLLRLLRRQNSERMAQVLLERHGARLARDPATEREVLRLLLWRLDREQGGYREVAAALIRHPTVLADDRLLWDAYRFLLRKHITCAEGQRLWNRMHPDPPGGRRSAVCQPWDDSPMPAGLHP